MAKIIKLENIVDAGFDSDTGDKFINVTEEYVCDNCHHLVQKEDKFCWFCGEFLVPSGKIEHYYRDTQLTNDQFKEELAQYEG